MRVIRRAGGGGGALGCVVRSACAAPFSASMAAPSGAAVPRPGMTPWSSCPSNISKRLVVGIAIHPAVANSELELRWLVTRVGPPIEPVR